MSDDETFLARWSRRKRQAALKPADRARPENAGGKTTSSSSPARRQPGEPQSTSEPKGLPAIESIDAGTDIRAFLAEHVPAELSRAALHRAWSTDPAIREFIGLSENSWDFNAIEGVPGFGSVTMEDVRQILARAEGGETDDANPDTNATPPQASAPKEAISSPAIENHLAQEEQTPTGDADTLPLHDSAATAKRPEPEEDQRRSSSRRRSHGGALPE